MKKQELRKIYKQKRTDLTDAEIKEFQENIYKQIFNLDLSEVQTVHLFLSLRKFNEIDTSSIISFLREKGKRIVVSKCNFEDNTLSHFYFDENTVLELNKFGVPEPINTEQVNETVLDLIFVPLLISDKQNFRVGYGKGFYDRFLSNCRKDAKKIGLNFFKPITKIEDVHEFDVALDSVIFPK
ncbi:5-formyltetrahydrofolate cyclo-ligase [Polaribacter pectinis]|uniref:5-formyltetrahydrofolate cyclo-ligase n=1 Tax=Polaribacter pectinis TaxID=2738844 RepID=A0A7G9LAI2_9FLAO|nr:5-formyltetrahydrofolate cyclo-ligase [Polaribacter pectinis]QNM85631.1 5-formyltetrahydrofolate cyclo-ligase [Polaribacter pectinis]